MEKLEECVKEVISEGKDKKIEDGMFIVGLCGLGKAEINPSLIKCRDKNGYFLYKLRNLVYYRGLFYKVDENMSNTEIIEKINENDIFEIYPFPIGKAYIDLDEEDEDIGYGEIDEIAVNSLFCEYKSKFENYFPYEYFNKVKKIIEEASSFIEGYQDLIEYREKLKELFFNYIPENEIEDIGGGVLVWFPPSDTYYISKGIVIDKGRMEKYWGLGYCCGSWNLMCVNGMKRSPNLLVELKIEKNKHFKRLYTVGINWNGKTYPDYTVFIIKELDYEKFVADLKEIGFSYDTKTKKWYAILTKPLQNKIDEISMRYKTTVFLYREEFINGRRYILKYYSGKGTIVSVDPCPCCIVQYDTYRYYPCMSLFWPNLVIEETLEPPYGSYLKDFLEQKTPDGEIDICFTKDGKEITPVFPPKYCDSKKYKFKYFIL